MSSRSLALLTLNVGPTGKSGHRWLYSSAFPRAHGEEPKRALGLFRSQLTENISDTRTGESTILRIFTRLGLAENRDPRPHSAVSSPTRTAAGEAKTESYLRIFACQAEKLSMSDSSSKNAAGCGTDSAARSVSQEENQPSSDGKRIPRTEASGALSTVEKSPTRSSRFLGYRRRNSERERPPLQKERHPTRDALLFAPMGLPIKEAIANQCVSQERSCWCCGGRY
jgi:hypothetical protein